MWGWHYDIEEFEVVIEIEMLSGCEYRIPVVPLQRTLGNVDFRSRSHFHFQLRSHTVARFRFRVQCFSPERYYSHIAAWVGWKVYASSLERRVDLSKSRGYSFERVDSLVYSRPLAHISRYLYESLSEIP